MNNWGLTYCKNTSFLITLNAPIVIINVFYPKGNAENALQACVCRNTPQQFRPNYKQNSPKLQTKTGEIGKQNRPFCETEQFLCTN